METSIVVLKQEIEDRMERLELEKDMDKSFYKKNKVNKDELIKDQKDKIDILKEVSKQ